jgi:trehalose 6-phosphate synthase
LEIVTLTCLFVALAALVATLSYFRRGVFLPLLRVTEWMRRLRAGEPAAAPRLPRRGPLSLLAREAATLVRRLGEAERTATLEARLRDLRDSLWTAERLREHARRQLGGQPLLVAANREPYRHSRREGSIVCQMPASGLVTALEPLLRACGGTWVAHGDGDADAETSDAHSRLRVPPDEPRYTLRRVWLAPRQEQGYYYGFANEGLWPLCHIAHRRPLFRPGDWAHYQDVNERFADVVNEELEGQSQPCVLVQDYHLTLLPRLLKARRADARLALFWHIPWPNPEAFGICPWQKELLDGMLGADMIGFHTQYHCNNFLETVDRCLQSHIDRERFVIERGRHQTVVKPFPISVEFPVSGHHPVARGRERARLLKAAGVRAQWLAVGVDRLDYTKGLLERFRGVECFLERHPRYRGHFALIQIGAPTRGGIAGYRDFVVDVETEARRINARFPGSIALILRHHSHEEILPYYRAADVCLVTSLHDGMNLVAKEFVVAREDGMGVLVLSRFTGAARELRDALIINPYDVEELAEALRMGLEMDEAQAAMRMARMRAGVRDNNIYKWGADLISELAAIRL